MLLDKKIRLEINLYSLEKFFIIYLFFDIITSVLDLIFVNRSIRDDPPWV